MLAPELVEQPVGRDDPAGVEHEQAQERALLVAAERDRPAVALDLEGSEDAQVKHGRL